MLNTTLVCVLQWFGNVVTMEWWDDLWLSEGFTSYMEHIGTDHVQPDLKSVRIYSPCSHVPALCYYATF